MKNPLLYYIHIVLFAFILIGCGNYRKLLTDEIVLNDGNSQTGTIIKCDSTQLKLKKTDESISIIAWTHVDTVQGKKLKTVFAGANYGYYNIPYFSVFRNEKMVGTSLGMQYKIGMAYRGTNLYYLHLTYSPAKPYAITKFGIGYQRYIGNSTYLKKKSFFWGSEINLMNVQYNNGAQTTLESFTGLEKKINEHILLHFKFALQFNVANKNNQTGVNLTIGAHFLKRNFKRYYSQLNKEHRLPRK